MLAEDPVGDFDVMGAKLLKKTAGGLLVQPPIE
jgi:hypothetical protein